MRESEDELTWVRFRIRRLRAVLRLISQPSNDLALAETILKELIGEAEQRLDDLEKRSQGSLGQSFPRSGHQDSKLASSS